MSKKLIENSLCNDNIQEYNIFNKLSRSIGFESSKYKISSIA